MLIMTEGRKKSLTMLNFFAFQFTKDCLKRHLVVQTATKHVDIFSKLFHLCFEVLSSVLNQKLLPESLKQPKHVGLCLARCVQMIRSN